jgi:hypothetical protein
VSVLSGSSQTNRAPDNVSSGDWTVTVSGTYACGSTVQPFDLSSATMSAGRYVLVRAGSITDYVGATVVQPSGRTVYSVSQEPVNFPVGGTSPCIVVTLV